MPTNIKILNSNDARAYDTPPVFDSEQRKRFFDLPKWADEVADNLRTPTNKVGFVLQLGYFRAADRFFNIQDFNPRDIELIAGRMSIVLDEIQWTEYSYTSYERHQEIILNRFGFVRFNEAAKQLLAKESLSLCSNQMKPKSMFMSLVDFLREKKIEGPCYFAIAKIITASLRQFEVRLVVSIKALMTDLQRQMLDDLLESPDEPKTQKSRYKVTLLKRSNQSTRPSKIKENIDDLECIKNIFDALEPLTNQLKLSPQIVRYYAELAIRSQVPQISRREENRYLLLISFVKHQYYRLNDTLIDALVQSCQTAKNSVAREAKEKFYESRQSRQQLIVELSKTMGTHLAALENIEAVITGDQLTDSQKILEIKSVLIDVLQPKYVQTKEKLALLEKESTRILKDDDYYDIFESHSLKLQNRASEIIKHIDFNHGTSNSRLLEAISYFKQKGNTIGANPPVDFLEDNERKTIFDAAGKLRVSLYKVLLFEKVAEAIKSGALNLRHSYKYQSFDEYLIPREIWEKEKTELLDRAGLSESADFTKILSTLEPALMEQYRITNENINTGKNKYARFDLKKNLIVTTPKVEKESFEPTAELFPKDRLISLYEILSTVNKHADFASCLEHWQIKYNRQKPHEKIFFAGVIGYGCNLGIGKIAKISSAINHNELENTVNWYFSPENLSDANDRILQFSSRLQLPSIYNRPDHLVHTSSDGKKYSIGVEALNARYSFKYFGQGMGVSSYAFIDNRHFLPHSTVITPTEREAAHVVDGLMHNDVVKSDIHSTDTHGYSEIIFGVTHLLGISFAPRIKNFKKQHLYAFANESELKALGYRLLADGRIDTNLIAEHWDDILRFIVTIKLKHVTASQLFRRLSSYSRQHSLYKALKQFGRIIKSLFLLRYIDDVELRQAIEKQLNKSENAHKFEGAIFYANNQEFQQSTFGEQLIAEGCKRLLENAIICWNYLYLSQLICNTPSAEQKKDIIETVKNGSIVTWQHINLQGEYDFSEKSLENSYDFKLPEILELEVA